MWHKNIPYLVRFPVPDEVRRHRAEYLGENVPVLLRRVIEKDVRIIRERVRDDLILALARLVFVLEGRRSHEGGDVLVFVLDHLRRDEAKVLCENIIENHSQNSI